MGIINDESEADLQGLREEDEIEDRPLLSKKRRRVDNNAETTGLAKEKEEKGQENKRTEEGFCVRIENNKVYQVKSYSSILAAQDRENKTKTTEDKGWYHIRVRETKGEIKESLSICHCLLPPTVHAYLKERTMTTQSVSNGMYLLVLASFLFSQTARALCTQEEDEGQHHPSIAERNQILINIKILIETICSLWKSSQRFAKEQLSLYFLSKEQRRAVWEVFASDLVAFASLALAGHFPAPDLFVSLVEREWLLHSVKEYCSFNDQLNINEQGEFNKSLTAKDRRKLLFQYSVLQLRSLSLLYLHLTQMPLISSDTTVLAQQINNWQDFFRLVAQHGTFLLKPLSVQNIVFGQVTNTSHTKVKQTENKLDKEEEGGGVIEEDVFKRQVIVSALRNYHLVDIAPQHLLQVATSFSLLHFDTAVDQERLSLKAQVESLKEATEVLLQKNINLERTIEDLKVKLRVERETRAIAETVERQHISEVDLPPTDQVQPSQQPHKAHNKTTGTVSRFLRKIIKLFH